MHHILKIGIGTACITEDNFSITDHFIDTIYRDVWLE